MRGLRAWGHISQNVMQDPSISVSAKALYALLCSYADRDGRCFPSNETLAEALGVSERYVQTNLRALLAAEVIVREERFEMGRQTTSVTRLIDGSTSPRGELEITPGGEPEFIQNKTTSNRKKTSSSSPRGRKSASTPWPEGWEPDGDLVRWTEENCPHIDTVAEWVKFRAHALANDRRQVRWEQAWRMWATKAEQDEVRWQERRPAKKRNVGSNWDRMRLPT